MHHLGPAGEDRGHIQMPDAAEEVAVEPDVDVRAELGDVDVGWWGRHLQDRVDEAIDVARADRDDQVLELCAPRRADIADIAEVEDADASALEQQEVARVGVGVEQAVAKDHFEIDLRGTANERVDVPAGGFQRGSIGERLPDEPAHGDDATARQLGVRRRDDDVGLVGEVDREALEVRGLLAQVDGATHHLVELRHDRRRAIARELRILLLDVLRERPHQVQVITDRAFRTVVQHLDDDLGAVLQRGCMDLRDGARPHRVGFERREQLLEWRSEILGHDPARDVRWIRRHRALELLELGGDLGADRIGPQAQHLPELDERRAELDRRPPHPLTR